MFVVGIEEDVVDKIGIVTRGNFASGYAMTHDIIGVERVGLEAQRGHHHQQPIWAHCKTKASPIDLSCAASPFLRISLFHPSVKLMAFPF